MMLEGGWSEKSSGVFEGRTSHTTTVFNNQVWMLGGYNNTSGVLGDVCGTVLTDKDFTQEVGDNSCIPIPGILVKYIITGYGCLGVCTLGLF